jgi:hypothetical protein
MSTAYNSGAHEAAEAIVDRIARDLRTLARTRTRGKRRVLFFPEGGPNGPTLEECPTISWSAEDLPTIEALRLTITVGR